MSSEESTSSSTERSENLSAEIIRSATIERLKVFSDVLPIQEFTFPTQPTEYIRGSEWVTLPSVEETPEEEKENVRLLHREMYNTDVYITFYEDKLVICDVRKYKETKDKGENKIVKLSTTEWDQEYCSFTFLFEICSRQVYFTKFTSDKKPESWKNRKQEMYVMYARPENSKVIKEYLRKMAKEGKIYFSSQYLDCIEKKFTITYELLYQLCTYIKSDDHVECPNHYFLCQSFIAALGEQLCPLVKAANEKEGKKDMWWVLQDP